MGQRQSFCWTAIQSHIGHLCFALFLALVLPLVPGCGGCSDDPTAQNAQNKEGKDKDKDKDKKADKPKPKPDFEKLKLTVMPSDAVDLTQGVKPGHWATATLDAKANNFDFSGELESGIGNSQGAPIDLEHTAYRMLTTRPANLPKGQAKRLELMFFVPRSTTSIVGTRLLGRGGGAEMLQDRQPVSHMPSYQYYLYVLSSQPDRYRYLKVLDSVKPPWDDLADKERNQYYRVQLPRVGQSVSLPSHPLTWTSIAVLVWDDIHPKVLRNDQQQAMLDWLNWGGQLIVSGPRTLDLLRGSFLEPYLPAAGGESTKLENNDVAELDVHWTVPKMKGLGTPLTVTQPWSAVKLVKHEAAEFVPGTGELIAERRIGRGRVVVTAFRLGERDLISWRSFDSLFNNVLLRHPRREYHEKDLQVVVDWEGISNRRLDPQLVSNLRYFSRDGGSPEDREKLGQEAGVPQDISTAIASLDFGMQPAEGSFEMELFENSRNIVYAAHQPGVAGWSDFNPVSSAARSSLREAAGIVVPQRGFVVWTVGLYLLVIVPLNWLVFWALGRVEWAWIAAPVIAVACAMAVVKLARLDIGFARSKTEIAVVEMQGDYPRAHVTRYTALYTSLSTGYDVHFDDPSALAAPFATDPGFHLLVGQSSQPVMFRRDNEVHLFGYNISSNSTGMLHSEQMLDLGGSIVWGDRGAMAPQLSNGTQLPLDGAAVVRKVRNDSKNLVTETAWIGQFRPRQDVLLDFKPIAVSIAEAEREKSAMTRDNPPIGAISLKSLVKMAEDTADMGEGDARLIAWTDEELPGMRIEPRSSQQRHATLVLANLKYSLGPPPMKDVNTRTDLKLIENDEEAINP